MFDFFKKDSDDELIRQACKATGSEDLLGDENFELYMKLMMKGYDEPTEITFTCIKVIVSLAKYYKMPREMFEGIMKETLELFDALPEYDEDLIKSMKKYDLI